MRSPGTMPARAAGNPGSTAIIVTPSDPKLCPYSATGWLNVASVAIIDISSTRPMIATSIRRKVRFTLLPFVSR
jgi:hypothetical protein